MVTGCLLFLRYNWHYCILGGCLSWWSLGFAGFHLWENIDCSFLLTDFITFPEIRRAGFSWKRLTGQCRCHFSKPCVWKAWCTPGKKFEGRFFFFIYLGKEFWIECINLGEKRYQPNWQNLYTTTLSAHSVNVFSHPSHQCSYRLYSTIVLSRALLRPKKVLFAFPGFCGYTRLYAYILRFGLRITEKREFAALTFG